MFLQPTDLYAKIRQTDIRQITGGEDTIVAHAISYAMGIIRSYLSSKYDVDLIFSMQGDQREAILISIGVDIAIYEIVSLAQPNIDLEDRRERNRQALDYLRQVRDEKIPTGWPLAPTTESTESPVATGSTPPRGNYY